MCIIHGSYNLEKVLNFSRHHEKSLNLVRVLEKYLTSLLGLEKYLKFNTLFMPHPFFVKIVSISSWKIWLILGVRTCKTHW